MKWNPSTTTTKWWILLSECCKGTWSMDTWGNHSGGSRIFWKGRIKRQGVWWLPRSPPVGPGQSPGGDPNVCPWKLTNSSMYKVYHDTEHIFKTYVHCLNTHYTWKYSSVSRGEPLDTHQGFALDPLGDSRLPSDIPFRKSWIRHCDFPMYPYVRCFCSIPKVKPTIL